MGKTDPEATGGRPSDQFLTRRARQAVERHGLSDAPGTVYRTQGVSAYRTQKHGLSDAGNAKIALLLKPLQAR